MNARRRLEALASGIDGWLADHEGRLLYELARRCTGQGVIVEIGSWKGRSTVWLASGSKAGAAVPVHAIDPHTGSPEHRPGGAPVATLEEFRANVARAGVDDIVVPLVKPSLDAAVAFVRPVELLFIDGDHAYEAVLADFHAWFPKVVDGGVIAFHDTIGWEGPERVVAEHLYRSPRFRGVRLCGSIVYGIKTERASLAERIRNRYALTVKRFAHMARRLRLPRTLRAAAGAVVRRLH
jgi:MMP 1-O-methyltransferase